MMDASTTISAGAILLTVVTIESGGSLLLRIATGRVGANDLQRTFFRAGHAHAGVLVILGLVALLLVDASGASGAWHSLGPTGILASAILIPAGFFLSVLGRDPLRPGRLALLIPAGAVVLAAGLVTTGVGLIATGATRG